MRRLKHARVVLEVFPYGVVYGEARLLCEPYFDERIPVGCVRKKDQRPFAKKIENNRMAVNVKVSSFSITLDVPLEELSFWSSESIERFVREGDISDPDTWLRCVLAFEPFAAEGLPEPPGQDGGGAQDRYPHVAITAIPLPKRIQAKDDEDCDDVGRGPLVELFQQIKNLFWHTRTPNSERT